jgi:hypothetical protein
MFPPHPIPTLYMVGLIWFVQIVHYPLFASVSRAEFQAYEKQHSALTTWVVGPPMLVELMTGLLLLRFPIAGVSQQLLWIGLGLIGLIWLLTAFVQMPCHKLLLSGFDPATHERLVSSNWLRTWAWTARGSIVLYIAWRAFGS